MGFNNVKIIQNGRHSKVFIDGVEVKGVRMVDYHNEVDEMPVIQLEFLAFDVEIDINESESQEENSIEIGPQTL